jgi:hypothetical protein
MEAGAGGCIVSIPIDAAGESFSFVTLDDGTLIIEDQAGEEPLDGVAAVIEKRIDAPYRARGFRIDAQRWVVVADPVDLVDLGTLAGDDVTVVAASGERRLVVDDAAVPIEQLPAALVEELDDSEPCVISASHVDDQWWELTVEELPREVGLPVAEEDAQGAAEIAEPVPKPEPVAVAQPVAAQAPESWTLTEDVDAPGLVGDALDFVAADAGTIVELGAEQPAGLLVPLRGAIEATLHPPYRAHASRIAPDRWRVQARAARIERFSAEGDEIALTHKGGLSELVVDGTPRSGTVPRLEVLGLTLGGTSYVARATHLRDDLWDVRIDRQ